MKNLYRSSAFFFISAFLLVFTLTSLSVSNVPKGNPDGLENITDNLFIPDAFFTKYKLELQERSNVHIKDWSTIDRTAKFGVVDDVRWEFKDADEAMAWHKKNLKVNSESGEELKDKMYIPGAQELHMYRESKSITDLNKSMGIDSKEYYFLFAMDKVVVKVFVTVNGEVSLEDASVFAKEAAKSVRTALGIVVPPPPKPAVVSKPKPVVVQPIKKTIK